MSILPTSAAVIEAGKGAQKVIVLDWLPYIQYRLQFRKDQGATIWVLIDSSSKVNAMTPFYAKQLGFRTQKTDIGAQKIDGSFFWTFEILIAGFQIKDKLGREPFV